MVQECYTYVDAETDLSIKLRLIDTLRTVTAGKVSTSTVFIALSVYQIYFLWAPLLYGSALHFIHAAYISRYMWRLSVPGWVKLWPISKSKMETWKRLHPFCRNCRWVLARDLLMCFVFVLLRPVQTKYQYSLWIFLMFIFS